MTKRLITELEDVRDQINSMLDILHNNSKFSVDDFAINNLYTRLLKFRLMLAVSAHKLSSENKSYSLYELVTRIGHSKFYVNDDSTVYPDGIKRFKLCGNNMQGDNSDSICITPEMSEQIKKFYKVYESVTGISDIGMLDFTPTELVMMKLLN